MKKKETEQDKKAKKTDEESVKKKKTHKSSSSDAKKKDGKKSSKSEDKKVKKPEEEVVKKKKSKHKPKDDSKTEKSETKAPPKILDGQGSSHTVEAFKKRYQVFSKQLGKGAFSEVRLGMNRETGEEVAIKIIDKINVSENFKKNLDREIKILKGVQHENIVCLKDMYDFEDKFLFVMELSTGGELFDRIVEKGTYSEDDAKNLIKGIVGGVEYLHSKGIVHRDLKPENLLLKSKDSDSEVKIADFGLSSFMNSETLLQTACGTPAYVAPEVLKSGGYDKSVDLWSVGVITYILLCGFPPFYADSVKDLLRIVVKAEFRFPSPYWDNISPPAKDFIKKLLTMADNRMSATEALQHPWLKSGGSNVDLKSFREQMKNYIIKRRGERNELIASAGKK